MQVPAHKSISRPVFLIKYFPRFLSGAKMIFCSAGICLIIFSAFDDVQIISLNALTAAEQLMYLITIWPGFASTNFLNSGAGQPSAREQPALISGIITFFAGFKIFAVSAMK